MTPELQTTFTPDERAALVSRLEAVIDARLSVLVADYERRWADLAPAVRDWLAEMLQFVVMDMRRALHSLVAELLPPSSRVH